jgi:hypothetical protein
MTTDTLIRVLAFSATLLATEMIENIFLINYENGRFKFRFHKGNLNPFISKDRAFLIWLGQLLIAGLLSIPLGNYFTYFINVNQFYYIPMFSLLGITAVVFGTRVLKIGMTNNMKIAIFVLMGITIVSIWFLTNGDISKLHPLNIPLNAT